MSYKCSVLKIDALAAFYSVNYTANRRLDAIITAGAPQSTLIVNHSMPAKMYVSFFFTVLNALWAGTAPPKNIKDVPPTFKVLAFHLLH